MISPLCRRHLPSFLCTCLKIIVISRCVYMLEFIAPIATRLNWNTPRSPAWKQNRRLESSCNGICQNMDTKSNLHIHCTPRRRCCTCSRVRGMSHVIGTVYLLRLLGSTHRRHVRSGLMTRTIGQHQGEVTRDMMPTSTSLLSRCLTNSYCYSRRTNS